MSIPICDTDGKQQDKQIISRTNSKYALQTYVDV